METYEPPQTFTKKNIIYWNPEYKELKGTHPNICTKARKFLKENCIIKTENGYLIKPIKNYNKTTYKVKNDKCTCQFYNKTNKTCSHILATKLFKQING